MTSSIAVYYIPGDVLNFDPARVSDPSWRGRDLGLSRRFRRHDLGRLDHPLTSLGPGPSSTVAGQGHHHVRILVVGLEDGGVLGVDQLGGDRGVVVEGLQGVGQVAGVEGDLDRLALVVDRQLDVRAADVGRLAGELQRRRRRTGSRRPGSPRW